MKKIKSTECVKLTMGSIISKDNKLYLFGGEDENLLWTNKYFFI
jgi:hypothetical protein